MNQQKMQTESALTVQKVICPAAIIHTAQGILQQFKRMRRIHNMDAVFDFLWAALAVMDYSIAKKK